MATFVFTYRMPAGYVPGGPDTMAAWAAWFDSMGESLSDRGNPVFGSAKPGNCGAETRPGGCTFVNAEDLEPAVALAKDPLLSRQAAASRSAPSRCSISTRPPAAKAES